MGDLSSPETPRTRGDSDAAHVSRVSPADDMRTVLINSISWGAVSAGIATAIVAQLLLNMIGIGIGASTLDPVGGDNPSATALSAGAGIWWAVSGVIAAFIGGYIASRLSGRPKESTGGWHGLTSWAMTTIIVFFLLGSAVGSVIGGAYNTVSGALGGLGKTAATMAQTAAPAVANATDPFDALEAKVRGVSGDDPAALRDSAVATMRALVTGNQGQVADARERAAQALAKAQGTPIEEARTTVAAYEQEYRQAADRIRQQAAQAADTTAKAVTRGALLASLALILGAIAAWFGGRAGSVEPTVTARFFRRAGTIPPTGRA